MFVFLLPLMLVNKDYHYFCNTAILYKTYSLGAKIGHLLS